jgi:hypothetical protein
VEPNPGPTWEELLKLITEKFNGKIPQPVLDHLSKICAEICVLHSDDSNFLYPDTDHVLEYLKNNSVIPQLAKLIKEAITSLQPGTAYLRITFLTFSSSSATTTSSAITR